LVFTTEKNSVLCDETVSSQDELKICRNALFLLTLMPYCHRRNTYVCAYAWKH